MVLAPVGTLPTGVVAHATNGTFDVAPVVGSYSIPVVVTVTFDEDADDGTQDGEVDLTGLHFLLQQYIPVV